MTLKEHNRTHTKERITPKLHNTSKKQTSTPRPQKAPKSFLARVLSPDPHNKSFSSNSALFPALKQASSLASSSNNFPLQEGSVVPNSVGMASIFKLKCEEQNELEQQLALLEERESARRQEVDNIDGEEGEDNASYTSEATVEFCREATEYFLEDQNRVHNQRMFVSEPKFHRAFRVEANAYLPSLKQLKNRNSNASAEADDSYEPPGVTFAVAFASSSFQK
jgi:hypothetical protein